MADRDKKKAFHWINKDQLSAQLSRSQGNEATSILRFVQRGRVKTKRWHIREKGDKNSHDFVAFSTGVQQSISNGILDSSDGCNANSKASHARLKSMQSRWRMPRPANNNVIEGSAVDPFASSLIPLSESTLSLITYSKQSIASGSGGYKLKAFPEPSRPFTEMYHAAMEYSMQNMGKFDYILYPMLAAFSQRFWLISRTSYHFAKQPGYYLQLGLTTVRRAIAAEPGDSTTLRYVATGIHFLVCAAGLSGRTGDSRLHLRAFLRLLPHIDTATLIGLWELDIATSIDLLNSACDGYPPNLKFAAEDPGGLAPSRQLELTNRLKELVENERRGTAERLSPDLLPDPAIFARVTQNCDLLEFPSDDLSLDLGSSLDHAFGHWCLPPQIVQILRKLLDCLSVAKVIWRDPDFVNKADSTWLCQRTKSVLHELLSMTGPRAISTSTIIGKQVECLRVTLCIVVAGAQHRLLYVSRYRQASRLKLALKEVVELDWNQSVASADGKHDRNAAYDANEMLLWILITGYWAHAYVNPEGQWFATHAVSVAKDRLGLKTYSDLHKVMKKYLYGRIVQGRALMDIAEMLDDT